MNSGHHSKIMYGIGGITIAILIALIIVVIYPLYTKITTTNKDIYDQRVQLAVYEQQRSNADATRQDYNKIKNDTDSIAKIFISKDKMLDFISSLENIASTHSLEQSINLDTDSSATTRSDSSLALTITLNGTWSNIINYLADLERADYYFSIQDLAITAHDNNLGATLGARIYTQ